MGNDKKWTKSKIVSIKTPIKLADLARIVKEKENTSYHHRKRKKGIWL